MVPIKRNNNNSSVYNQNSTNSLNTFGKFDTCREDDHRSYLLTQNNNIRYSRFDTMQLPDHRMPLYYTDIPIESANLSCAALDLDEADEDVDSVKELDTSLQPPNQNVISIH